MQARTTYGLTYGQETSDGMNRDIILMKFPGVVTKVEEVTDELAEDLGTPDELVGILSGIFPDADFSDPWLGILNRERYSIEFHIPEQANVTHLTLHVKGDAESFQAIKMICDRTGWTAMDDASIIDFGNLGRQEPAGPQLQRYTGFWKRVGMRILDVVISTIPCVLLYRYSLQLSIRFGSVMPFVLYWVLFCTVFSLFIVRFGGTPGKLIMKAKIVDKHGQTLGVSGAVRRIAFYVIGAICLIPVLHLDIQSQVQEKDVLHYISKGTSIYHSIYRCIGLLACFSDFFVLFNRKRRALHDFLAGSFVVDTGTDRDGD